MIPSEGSVGASGDLTPLSYLAAVLCGEGEVCRDGSTMSAAAALAEAGIAPLRMRPKEALGDHERHGGDDGSGLSRLCARRIFDPAGNSHHGDGLVCARRQRLSFRCRRCFR